jgi:hypothetical protein
MQRRFRGRPVIGLEEYELGDGRGGVSAESRISKNPLTAGIGLYVTPLRHRLWPPGATLRDDWFTLIGGP